MVYFVTIGQLYKTTSFLVVSAAFHSEMRKSGGNEETTLFFHYNYQTKTCNHSVVKTTNLFLQCIASVQPQHSLSTASVQPQYTSVQPLDNLGLLSMHSALLTQEGW